MSDDLNFFFNLSSKLFAITTTKALKSLSVMQMSFSMGNKK